MKIEQFNEIVNHRVNKIKFMLHYKGEEYGSKDRLHNFKVAARIKNESMLKAAWGMAAKHLVCVADMAEGVSEITPYMVEEKIGDMINYLILMEAICWEMMEGVE